MTTGVVSYSGTHKVRTTRSASGAVIVTEAGQAVEGGAGTQAQQVN